MLEDAFLFYVGKYFSDKTMPERLWNELVAHLREKHRCYHTLTHLENMYEDLARARSLVSDWDATVIALCYHDIIYNPRSNKNEEESAGLAKDRLSKGGFPSEKTSKVISLILATKSHTHHNDDDINYFTDADLAILGKSSDEYHTYTLNVRKEFSIYPDFLYKPGRKKVLKHFLAMQRIYKTDLFFGLYEDKARRNIGEELKML